VIIRYGQSELIVRVRCDTVSSLYTYTITALTSFTMTALGDAQELVRTAFLGDIWEVMPAR
jgi:hypothetical protein